jgi:hypothetical protein
LGAAEDEFGERKMGKFKAIVYVPAERPNEPRIEQTRTFETEHEATAWAKNNGAEEYAVLPDEEEDQIQEKVDNIPGPLAEMADPKGASS